MGFIPTPFRAIIRYFYKDRGLDLNNNIPILTKGFYVGVGAKKTFVSPEAMADLLNTKKPPARAKPGKNSKGDKEEDLLKV